MSIRNEILFLFERERERERERKREFKYSLVSGFMELKILIYLFFIGFLDDGRNLITRVFNIIYFNTILILIHLQNYFTFIELHDFFSHRIIFFIRYYE